jgi:RNA polymerase sigma factor (TIGR02999 family)
MDVRAQPSGLKNEKRSQGGKAENAGPNCHAPQEINSCPRPEKLRKPGARMAAIPMSPRSQGTDEPPAPRVTELLLSWRAGDDGALAQLVPLVFDELRRLARRHMRSERTGHVLQTTALVNEAYVRLIDLSRVQWQDRAHFFAMASRLMRRILVDFARAGAAKKRGGDHQIVPLEPDLVIGEAPDADLVALDDALNALAKVDERKSRVVEMRFFGGLSIDETAESLGVSPETVARDWRMAKLWLLRELGGKSR